MWERAEGEKRQGAEVRVYKLSAVAAFEERPLCRSTLADGCSLRVYQLRFLQRIYVCVCVRVCVVKERERKKRQLLGERTVSHLSSGAMATIKRYVVCLPHLRPPTTQLPAWPFMRRPL